jgi:uncharacterized NAD(P)/FAD-binding protein YdhS
MARRTVAVVGGGCSGVLVTREILRRTGDDVVMVEPGVPGGGVAYGAARPWHLLNSRAGAMSADAGDPGHFARWSGATPDEFVPRATYGRYLRAVLDEAGATHPGRLDVRRARVTAVRPGPAGCTVTLGSGADLHADHVVLATGNPAGALPPAVPPEVRGHPAYVADPWCPGALDAVPADAPVLLIGTGLTAVDVALSLTADDRRTGPVVAVSRRGLLPLSHTPAAAPPRRPDLDDCARLRDVIRAVRAAAGEAGDWRAVVDGMRPHLDRLWGALTPAEQDAFLRHLARPWECHRHRMPPRVADRIAALRRDGRLVVRAGGIREVRAGDSGGLTVRLADGAAAYGAVINCAGPGRLPGSADPLTAALLDAGLVRVGPHGLGLDVDVAGRPVAADGVPHERLWLVGPLRRGTLWETTAMPEIRAQAGRLAAGLAVGGATELRPAA